MEIIHTMNEPDESNDNGNERPTIELTPKNELDDHEPFEPPSEEELAARLNAITEEHYNEETRQATQKYIQQIKECSQENEDWAKTDEGSDMVTTPASRPANLYESEPEFRERFTLSSSLVRMMSKSSRRPRGTIATKLRRSKAIAGTCGSDREFETA